jgi:Cu(I)/Ag(I) efflux system membrane fusion protein
MKTKKRKLAQKRGRKIAWIAGSVFTIVLLISLRAAASKEPVTEALQAAVKVIDKVTLQLSDTAMAGIQTAQAKTEDFPETMAIMGSIDVVENMQSVVSSRVNGRVDKVLRVTGETVKAGEALALMYSPDYISAREEYLQVMRTDLGTKDNRESDLIGFTDLASKKLQSMGLNSYDIANLSDANDYLEIRASQDGVITSVNTGVGKLQNFGDTLFTTANLDKVWFSGDLYTEDVEKVHRGQTIYINAEGLDMPLSGSISFISPVVDANSRTVKVRALINNPDHVLRAAMFVEGKLLLNNQKALVVPAEALLNVNGKTYCFKALGENRFEEVPVSVGRQNDTSVGIVAGLSEGDQVVSKDCATLDRALDVDRASN